MHRRRVPELMDQPSLELREHVCALQGLRRINQLSRTSFFLWSQIFQLAQCRSKAEKPLRILDVASGGGDTAIALEQRAAHCGVRLEIEGCDISPKAVDHARSQAEAAGSSVRFFLHDALRDKLPDGYDVVCSSLFLHHLAESEAVGFLRRMAEAARCLVLVDDLSRSRRGYVLALLACHLFTRSRVVHNDGPISVAAAFTPDEALLLTEQAGLSGATLTRHWPQRFLITWRAG